MRPTFTLIFAAAVLALVGGIVKESWPLLAVSALASLTVIAVGIGAGGWRALNPFDRRKRVASAGKSRGGT